MQNKIIFLFSLLLVVFFVNAQEVSEENIWKLLDCKVIATGVSLNSNLAIINQAGDENEIISIQQQEEVFSNVIITGQFGTENSGYIKQIGSAHATALIQSGSGNEANLWSVGTCSVTKVYQTGNNNFINSYIDNQDFLGKTAVLVQEGDNNNIEIALLGNGSLWNSLPKTAVIEQRGNNLQITAKMDSYRNPVLIQQQSGISGGGMKIDISNSDFNFPMK